MDAPPLSAATGSGSGDGGSKDTTLVMVAVTGFLLTCVIGKQPSAPASLGLRPSICTNVM